MTDDIQSENLFRLLKRDRKFRKHFAITLMIKIAVLGGFTRFILWNETREGIVVPDPILAMFPAHDVAALTFLVIYIALIAGIIHFCYQAHRLLIAITSYIFLLIFRTVTMYLLPLKAPMGMIPLIDPIVSSVANSQVLERDLFFSGHTATMFLLFLLARSKTLKTIFGSGVILVGGLVLVQHVHYTIDVMAAPFFAFVSYVIGRRIVMDQDVFQKLK